MCMKQNNIVFINNKEEKEKKEIVTEKDVVRIWLLIPFVCHLQTLFNLLQIPTSTSTYTRTLG